MCSDLMWSRHHDVIMGKAYKQLGLLRRTFAKCEFHCREAAALPISGEVTANVLFPYLAPAISERYPKVGKSPEACNKIHSKRLHLGLSLKTLVPQFTSSEFEINDIMFCVQSLQSPSNHFN